MPFSLKKFFHLRKESKKIDLINQNLRERYWTEEELQRLLISLFNDKVKDVRDFDIKLKEDEWTFNAPRLVTDAEFRVARGNYDKEKVMRAATNPAAGGAAG